MMKVNNFIELLIKYEKVPTLYKLGTFLNKYDGKYLLSECSGLIKAILWGYPDNGSYQGGSVPDINADTMMLHCTKVSTDFSNLPVGALVHMKGHIGVHIGNGVCIESSPKWENGIQKTFITGSGFSNKNKLNSRKWQNWGLFRYIDYTTETPQPTPSDDWVNRLNAECARQGFSSYPTVKKGAKGGITRLIQERLNSVGFNLDVDGEFGTDTYNAVKVFQRNRGLSQDGIVGKNSWSYLLSGKRY